MNWAARDDTGDDDDDDADGLGLEFEEEFRFDLVLDVLLLGRLGFPDDCEFDFPFPPLPRLTTCSAMFGRLDIKGPGATWKASVVPYNANTISCRRVAIVVTIMVLRH